MKTEELRIGNLLIDSLTGELLKVCDLSESHITTSVIDRSKFPLPKGWQANPMPLTEEWLLKFGFEPIYFVSDSSLSCYDLSGISYLNANFELKWFGTKIEYVHQLQNLIHSLTGEELTAP